MKIKLLSIILVLISLSSCNCEKRLAYIQKYYPECLTPVVISDTVTRKEFQFDTVFYTNTATNADTFYITKKEVQVQIIRHKDTLFADVFLPADTIIKTIEVPIPQPTMQKSNKNCASSWRVALWIIPLCLVLILFIIRNIKSKL